MTVPGVILAGGLATRMGGGDKGLREIGGRRLLDLVIERLAPQCASLRCVTSHCQPGVHSASSATVSSR